jgi:hypothetical protein
MTHSDPILETLATGCANTKLTPICLQVKIGSMDLMQGKTYHYGMDIIGDLNC